MVWLDPAGKPRRRFEVLYLEMSSVERSTSFCFGFPHKKKKRLGNVLLSQ